MQKNVHDNLFSGHVKFTFWNICFINMDNTSSHHVLNSSGSNHRVPKMWLLSMLSTLTFHIPPPAGSTGKGSARRAVLFIQYTSTLKPPLYGLRWWEHHAIKSIRGKKVHQWEEHEYCRATFQVVGGDRHSNSCQRGWGDFPGGQLRKGLQSTQSKGPLWLPSPIALAAIGQSSLNMVWTQRCKPALGATSCNSSPSICSGLLVAQSPKFNAQSPGFSMSESHQNHHANTILGTQSHTNWWKKFC